MAQEHAAHKRVTQENAAHEHAAHERVVHEHATHEHAAQENATHERAAQERAAHENAAHEHAPQEHSARDDDGLCDACEALYTRAFRDGHLLRDEAERAPCLTALGLLRPDPGRPDRLRVTRPSAALYQLLHGTGLRTAEHRREQAALAAAFEPLLALPAAGYSAEEAPSVVHEGIPAIQEAVFRAAGEATREILAIQPGGQRPAGRLPEALPFEQRLLGLGGRIRTLYQHTTRHSPPALAHYEQLAGDVEVRSLDELPKRLFVFDRAVAFLPVGKDTSSALELRRPTVVAYLAETFELLWRHATPMYPHRAEIPSPQGVTPRRRAIAALLTEGLTDAEIAARLGMNVRTVRVHIARLSAVLDSRSRAQLGYLIGRAGILNQNH
ncbi:helix-turn-helix transcriptional regulator [Streptomyces longispororuber]|uniref:helix-turn-helix transcriptional regulator n=1 Tax=Streptomyces longispororuber TaxID=68230 RepID=UPI0033D50EA7